MSVKCVSLYNAVDTFTLGSTPASKVVLKTKIFARFKFSWQ